MEQEGSKIGVLTKEEAKFYGQLIADEIPVKGMFKPIVKWALPTFVDTIDNKYGDKIPQPWQSHLETLTTKLYNAMQDKVITEEEEQELVDYCAVVINEKIDIPLLEEEDEVVIFLATWKQIAALVRAAVKKLKNK